MISNFKKINTPSVRRDGTHGPRAGVGDPLAMSDRGVTPSFPSMIHPWMWFSSPRFLYLLSLLQLHRIWNLHLVAVAIPRSSRPLVVLYNLFISFRLLHVHMKFLVQLDKQVWIRQKSNLFLLYLQ